MKHDAIDRIYGDVFMGEPMEDGETWPRDNVMLRNGQMISWVPGNYEDAIAMFEAGRLDKVRMIHEELRILCVPIPNPEERIAALRAAISADQAARARV